MPQVEAALVIAATPTALFARVGDPEQRRRLLPDNFSGFERLTDGPPGLGTRYAFLIATPTGPDRQEVEITAWEPPHALTERTPGPDGYTVTWRFVEGPGAGETRASALMEYRAAGSIMHRLLDRWFGRQALRQSMLVELLRLKAAVEDETVEEAGGDGEP